MEWRLKHRVLPRQLFVSYFLFLMLGSSQHSQLLLLVKEGLLTFIPKYFCALAGNSSLILLFGLK